MFRWFIRWLVMHVLVLSFMPSLILLEFQVDRARIERELCVQRDRMENMRNCHGECQLSKRFKVLEKDAVQGYPVERMALRFEPVTDIATASDVPPEVLADLFLPDHPYSLPDGAVLPMDHVPKG